MIKLNFSKIKKLNTPYPIITINNFLNLNTVIKFVKKLTIIKIMMI